MLQVSATFNVIGSPAEVAYIANLLAGQTEFAAQVDSSIKLDEDARILLGDVKAKKAITAAEVRAAQLPDESGEQTLARLKDTTPAETIAIVFKEPVVEPEVGAAVASLDKAREDRKAATSPETTPDYDFTAKYITRISTEKGMAAARAFLAQFDGAKRLQDVDPSKFNDVIEAAELALVA